MSKNEDIAKFMMAIKGQESGGDYTKPNESGSGCTGAYQFCQGTWDAYASSVAPEYVGIDPASAPPDVQDAVMYAKTSEMYDRYGGDTRLMALEHYGGSGVADRAMETGVISDAPEWFNGDKYPSQLEYANAIANASGSAVPSFGGMDKAVSNSRPMLQQTSVLPIFINPDIYKVDNTELNNRPFFDKLSDSFQNMWYENGTISAIRSALIKSVNRGYEKNWTPSDDDLKLMDDLLGNNKVAKQAVLLNSDNEAQFRAFLKTKKEDIDRAKRAEQTSWGIHSIIGGGLGMLLDPLNLIPFVGEGAMVAKVGSKLGLKTLENIGAKRVYQIAESGATQGLVNMADSYLSERHGINEANYAVSGLLGAAGGAGVRLLRTMRNIPGTKLDGENMQKFIAQTKAQEEQAVRGAMDMADNVSLVTNVDLRHNDTPVERAVSEVLRSKEDIAKGLDELTGRKVTTGKAMEKAVRMTTTKLQQAKTVSDLVGRKASTLLRKAGLDKDASLSDLLQVARDNPDIGRQVRKATEKYLKTPFSDGAWNGFLYKKGEKSADEKAKYAMEALTDSEKANNVRLQIEKNTGEKVTNEDVRRSLKKILYQETGVTYKESGDIIINGTRIRPESPVHDSIVHPDIYSIGMDAPELEDMTVASRSVSPTELKKDGIISREEQEAFQKDTEFGSKTLREVEKESQVAFKSRVMQYVGRKLQDSKYLGNTYGHFTNSVSNHLRDFGRKMLGDTRQNADRLTDGMTLDFNTRKAIARRELQNYLGQMYSQYVSFFNKNPGTPTEVRQKFGKLFTEAYDSKVKKGQVIDGYPDEIKEAVKLAEQFRKEEQWMLHKAGLLDDVIPDTGFYRNADVDKVADFLTHFDTTDDAIRWLKRYGAENADRSALERMWKEDLAKREADIEARRKAGKKITEAEEEALATETLNDFINREAHNWAYGIIDRNLSNSRIELRDLNHMNKLEQYQRRFPVDTAAISSRELPNGGGLWSFDDCMRDHDIFKTMERIADRSSAKATLRSFGVTDMGKFFDDYRDKIYRELRGANENRRLINRSKVEESLEEFDYVVSKLMGYRYGTKQAQDPMKGMVRLLNKLSYSMNGFNMGLNQINENMGLMSVTGSRAITHMIPGLDKVLQGMRHTALSPDEIKKLRIASDYAHYNFLNPMDLTTPQVERIGLRAKVMAKANTMADYASDMTSMINRLSAWTSNAVSLGEADVMSDLVDWAVLGKTRKKIFSDRFMREAGVRDVDKFKDTINKYFGNLDHDDPDAVFKAIHEMQEKDYQAFVSMRALSAQAVQRGILQPNLSNDNYFAKKGMWPILFQFKNFSRMALYSHLARALERPDREVMTQLLSSGVAGAGIWALRTQAYANYKYKDEKERQKYLDDTLTADNFARAGITRSSLLAGLSYGNDLYEMISGAPTVRTTVNRQGQATGIGDYVNQLPAFGSANTIVSGVGGVWGAMHDLVKDHEVYQDDAKTVANMFPIDKFVGTQAVLSGMLDIHKGQTVENNFKKRPEKRLTNNPVQMLKDYVTGTNDVKEQNEKMKESQKKKRDKNKKKEIIPMNGERW